MSGIKHALRRFAGDETGHVAVIVGLMLTVLMGFVALGVDTAMLYRTKSRLQSVADLSAMTALRDTDAAQDRALAAVDGNGMASGTLDLVETGRYLRNPALAPEDRFVALDADAAGVNAVRVALGSTTPLHFAKVITDRDSVALSASAIAARSGAASFALDSHILRLDALVLEDLLTTGLGVNIGLSVGDETLLAQTDFSAAALMAALSDVSGFDARNPAEILDQAVTLAELGAAVQGLVDADTGALLDPLLGSTREIDVAAVVGGMDTSLGLSVTEAAADIDLSALDVLAGAAQTGLAGQSLGLDLGVSVPGVLGTTVALSAGEPPVSSGWIALGEEGVTLRHAATRLDVDVDMDASLLGVLGVGVTALNLSVPLTVELAGAQATLSALTCDADGEDTVMAGFITGPTPLHPNNGTSVAALYLGEPVGQAGDIDPAALDYADLLELELRVPLLLLPDLVVPLTVQARSSVQVGQSEVETLTFTQGDIASGDTTKTFGSEQLLSTAVSSLLGENLEIRVKPGQTGLVTGTVSALVATVLAILPDRLLSGLLLPVDGVLDAVLAGTGLHLGEGALTLTGHHCELVRLVQ
ncbi:TadG family pilus assembly protein [Sagittula sp. SSi028]|uniref:TadG family pilus assembly protein n=1 Tax=Sagittula sp. SSi028 TaxID=3400636 RepID=UPI003AF81053